MSQTSVPQEGTAKSVRGNRRATVRYRCAPATIGKVFVDDDQEYQRACIVDLSVKGVGLLLTRYVESGQFLHIAMKSNDGVRTFEFLAQVAHCDQTPHGEWIVGCELMVDFTAEDLDQLL